MWISLSGAEMRLSARPEELRKNPGTKGELHIEWTSRSLVPQTLAVTSLFSNHPTIATPSLLGSPAVRIERRPNKHSAAVPSKGAEKVGEWAPQNVGFATLSARAEFQASRLVISPDLEDDVRVI